MHITQYSSKVLCAQIRSALSKRLDLTRHKVFVFGSRTGSNYSDRSDIDIGIEGPKPISPEIKMEILDDLEKIPTLYKIDLVDFARVSPQFREEALKHIEPII